MCMVVLVHLTQKMPCLPGTVFSFGAMGVQLFFVLSGYCLCMKLGKKCQSSKKQLINRYRRLAPWYLTGMGLYAAYYWLTGNSDRLSSFTVGNVAANLLLVNTFFPSAQNTIVPGGWSISCIAVFSFVFPLFVTDLDKVRVKTLAVTSALGLAISIFGYGMFNWPRQYSYCSIMNQFVVFVLGVAYFIARPRLIECIRLIWAAVIAFTFFALAVGAVVLDKEHAIFYRHVLISLSFVSGLLILERMDAYMPGFMVWIGKHSYEIFIFHFLAIWMLP